MEQKRRNPVQWFQSLYLSHKTMISVGLLIFCSNLLILILVSRAATGSLRQKTIQQLQSQLTVSLSTVSSTMDDLTELMLYLTKTSDVVDFTTRGPDYEENYLEIVNNTNEVMRFVKQASNIVDYVGLLRMDSDEFLYIGEIIPEYNIKEIFLDNFSDAQPFSDQGIRRNFLINCYSVTEMNLYCPIYEKYTISAEQPEAVLVVGINTEKLLQYVSVDESSLKIRMLTADGVVTASEENSEVGTQAAWAAQYGASNGELSINGELVVFQRSENGLWLADGAVAQSVLFSGIRQIAAVMSVVIFAFTALSIVFSTWLCKRFYEPMNEVLHAMERVQNGNLEVQMKPYLEKDFSQLSTGFNEMTSAIKSFISAIQHQEQENTEIRLNALQSQIKPHFLYNTLECIHWQALMEGASGASKMVMALSRYYRLCLSKGADIVPLSQELEHTESYITIQNMRFDDILSVTWDIPAELHYLEIPKITLQPLVENAIYHGIKPVENRKGHVDISGRQEEDCLILVVADDGIGMPQEEINRLNHTIDQLINDGSYGVKNVHKRLEIRYGKGYGLHYAKNEAGGITVTIRLPARKLVRKGQ